mgnify:CR=1 FL=1
MLHLFIDKQEVALSSELKIELYCYNPFFDRKSDFTYDIDIDLNIPRNARIYKHIDRLNISSSPSHRTAELYNDNKLIVRGTEAILSVDGHKAKIQLVAGNSELNYLATSQSLTMRDLDMGEIELDEDIAMKSLLSSSDEFDFVCPPCAAKWSPFGLAYWFDDERSSTRLYNNLNRPYYNNREQGQTDMLSFNRDSNLRPMVYLCAIVEKVITAMGYQVTTNVLRSIDRFKYLYIVNSINTRKFSEMVPNWKVNDFLTNVEKWCNILFLINPGKGTCDIITLDSFYKTADRVYISASDVIDSFERSYDSSHRDSNFTSYDNISYKIPNNEFYRYGVLSNDLRKACDWIEYESYEAVKREGIASKYNKMFIRVKDTGREFVVSKRVIHDGVSDIPYYYLRPVDYIGEIVDESSSSGLTLNIVPAPMVAVSLHGYYFFEGAVNNNGGSYCSLFTVIPYAIDKISAYEANEIKGVNEYIMEGINEVAVPDTMFVARYWGIQRCFWPSMPKFQEKAFDKLKWPLSLSTDQIVGFGAADSATYISNNTLYPESDLSIKTMYDEFYSKNINVSGNKDEIIEFCTDEILDSKSLFIIANKLYYCRYIQYEIQADGMRRKAKGCFHPAKV